MIYSLERVVTKRTEDLLSSSICSSYVHRIIRGSRLSAAHLAEETLLKKDSAEGGRAGVAADGEWLHVTEVSQVQRPRRQQQHVVPSPVWSRQTSGADRSSPTLRTNPDSVVARVGRSTCIIISISRIAVVIVVDVSLVTSNIAGYRSR